MPNSFSRNSFKINDIYEKFDKELWIVDNTYQRRKVWGEKDNIRLIETILLDLVIPEIFIWDCDTDPTTGKTITHIVDGQQRVNAIFDFIQDKYRLKTTHLLSEPIKSSHGDKLFSQLDDNAKKKIWRYEMSVVSLDSTFDLKEIKNMFFRLNLTDYSLNDQEKRNSFDSAFGRAAEELADNNFWIENKIFSPRDIRRMGDVEYCSNILLLCREGIVDQTKQSVLDDIYKEFIDEYKDKDEDLEKIYSAIDKIRLFINDETKSFVGKKIQMYTLFSLAFDIIDNSLNINDQVLDFFNQFVRTYTVFKNEYELESNDPDDIKAYEQIKRYKLASSEGVNKISNRVIRYEVLKKAVFNLDNISIDAYKRIEKYFCLDNTSE